MRAFIGIDFEDEIKKRILELQQRLKKYAVKGRWKHIDNFHLTLKFLNEIDLRQQELINVAMRGICSKQKPFSLQISGIGKFNGRDSIRVLWIGLTGDIQILNSLQNAIENELAPIGFPQEKRNYNPHITIAQDVVFECGFDEIKKSIGKFELNSSVVDSIYLFKSEQVQNKRIYTKIEKYALDLYLDKT